MVIQREVFHKTSIRVPNQDAFEKKLTNTQSFPLFKNANLTHKGIILKLMSISAFLVYYGFDVDLDSIIIYRRINTLENLSEPVNYPLLTFLRGCMTSILVNDMGNFIPFRVFMESTPPAGCTWGLNKFNITFQNICYPHQEPGPASDPPTAYPYINLKPFQHFISYLKLSRLSPSPAIANGSTDTIMEDIYSMFQE